MKKVTIGNLRFIFTEDGVYPYDRDDFNFADPLCISAINSATQIYQHYGAAWELSYVYIGRSGRFANDPLINHDQVYKIGSSYLPKTRTAPIHTIPFIDRGEAFKFEFALHIHLSYYALGEEFFELPDNILNDLICCQDRNDLCDLLDVPHDIDIQMLTKTVANKCNHHGKVKKHERFMQYRLAVPIDPRELKLRSSVLRRPSPVFNKINNQESS